LRRTVFLDRDGVLNELVPDPRSGNCESPEDPRDVALLPGAADAVRRLRAEGYLVMVVSNQPGAAKGQTSREAVDAVHGAVVAALAADGATVDAWRYCFHHPDAGDACGCRKPEPGLLLDAARELDIDLGASWMIGDSDTDVEAGRRAGVRTVLVLNPRSAHRRGRQAADLTVATLGEAADGILDHASR